jgi:hypothetical protein
MVVNMPQAHVEVEQFINGTPTGPMWSCMTCRMPYGSSWDLLDVIRLWRGTSEEGEIWVTAQNTNELTILLRIGGVETVVLPAGTAPPTISFSPDRSYAYVSNIELVEAIMTDDGCPSSESETNMRSSGNVWKRTAAFRVTTTAGIPGMR